MLTEVCFVFPNLYRTIFFHFDRTTISELYTLSLHDALPISTVPCSIPIGTVRRKTRLISSGRARVVRSEEHTSELQSRGHLVCRLLLEKKKTTRQHHTGSRRSKT